MKSFILAALVSVSALAGTIVAANADNIAVHGYTTKYGR